MRQMLKDFFYPVAQDPIFQVKADEWLAQRDRFRWDTSKLKILDNVVIGLSAVTRKARS